MKGKFVELLVRFKDEKGKPKEIKITDGGQATKEIVNDLLVTRNINVVKLMEAVDEPLSIID